MKTIKVECGYRIHINSIDMNDTLNVIIGINIFSLSLSFSKYLPFLFKALKYSFSKSVFLYNSSKKR